jgi:molybdate transport system substrate-binding protein
MGRPRTRCRVALAGAASLALFLPVGCGGRGDSLTVLGASSLSQALDEYGRSFHAAKVRDAIAGSDQLAAQVRQGLDADVFASADTGYPVELHRRGLAGRPIVFARNRLVLVTQPGGAAYPSGGGIWATRPEPSTGATRTWSSGCSSAT